MVLGATGQTAVVRPDGIALAGTGAERLLVPGRGFALLTAAPDGLHIAAFDGSCRAWTLEGHEVWHRGINEDKGGLFDLRFSAAGDGIACAWDYDGLFGLHFHSLAKGYSTELRQGWVPLGWSPDLRRFVTWQGGDLVELDRHQRPCGRFALADGLEHERPDGLVLDREAGQFVLLLEEEVVWVEARTPIAAVVARHRLPTRAGLWCRLEAAGRLAVVLLYQYPGWRGAAVLDRERGLVRFEPEAVEARLRGRRVVLHTDDGRAWLVGESGESEASWVATGGDTLLGADVVAGALTLVCDPGARLKTA